MSKAITFSLKRLFILICSLKIISSFIGWYFNQPWVFGLILPLAFMAAYIVIGYNYREKQLSVDKFADSCYYLGFVFTIVSIIFSLFDLPNIGENLTSIAVRFGAAMVSTVLGLFVRVALVSFRPTAEDALRNVEDEVLDASGRLTEEFENTFQDLQDFRSTVHASSKDALTSVTTQFEALVEQNTARMNTYFEATTKANKESLASIIQDIRIASLGLSRVVNEYEGSIRHTVQRIDGSVDGFSEGLVGRLKSIEFPDDLFSRKLESPIGNLSESTDSVTAGVSKVSKDVLTAARAVDKAVLAINLKAESMSQTLDLVKSLHDRSDELMGRMAAQQDGVMNLLKTQQDALTLQIQEQSKASNHMLMIQSQELLKVANGLVKHDQAIETLLSRLAANQESADELSTRVNRMANEQDRMIGAIQESLNTLANAFTAASNRNEAIASELQRAQQASLAADTRLVKLIEVNELFLSQNSARTEQSEKMNALYSRIQQLEERLTQKELREEARPAIDGHSFEPAPPAHTVSIHNHP